METVDREFIAVYPIVRLSEESAAGKVGTSGPRVREASVMKVYVGMKRSAGRRVFVAMEGEAGEGDYRLCADDEAETTATVALAILADYLGEMERAAAVRAPFEGVMRERLAGTFWTLTEAELAQTLSGLGAGL
jgi:hypothetical protein